MAQAARPGLGKVLTKQPSSFFFSMDSDIGNKIMLNKENEAQLLP